MTTTLTHKFILSISGLTAVGIGAAILIVPMAFHSTNGIALGDDSSLLSEIRAPGGALLTMGVFMLAGLLRERLVRFSLGVGAAVFLSYGLSRCLAIALDGWPASGLVAAAAFELLIGALCVFGLVGNSRAARHAGQPLDHQAHG
tara:strand:- start:22 stop:456 length:435 start_codon:yes stop_codon:yes gene_type:complete